jgi:putative ABC transport system permease protein
MLVPMATWIVLRMLRFLFSLVPGIILKIASRNIGRSLSRTGVAIASLMIAVSVIVGVGTMVGSFRSTVVAWLSNTIRSDLYIRPANDLGEAFDSRLKSLLEEIEGVDRVYGIRSRQIAFGPYANSILVSLDRDTAKREWLWQMTGEQELETLFEQGSAFVSEPFAWKHRIQGKPGINLILDTDDGPKQFPVAGIFRDFSSEQGVIVINDRTYRRYWHDNKLFGLSLVLKQAVEPGFVQKQIESTIGNRYNIVIRSDQGLRNAAIEVFDRTFTITLALQILAGLVAFIGVLNTVMSLMLERSREIGVLRANGMTLSQLWRMVLMESGLIGLLAGVFALPLGTLMAWILVFIINKRSFGWTLDFVLDPNIYLQAVAIALIAALLAGIYPVAAMIRKPVAELLRTE